MYILSSVPPSTYEKKMSKSWFKVTNISLPNQLAHGITLNWVVLYKPYVTFNLQQGHQWCSSSYKRYLHIAQDPAMPLIVILQCMVLFSCVIKFKHDIHSFLLKLYVRSGLSCIVYKFYAIILLKHFSVVTDQLTHLPTAHWPTHQPTHPPIYAEHKQQLFQQSWLWTKKGRQKGRSFLAHMGLSIIYLH